MDRFSKDKKSEISLCSYRGKKIEHGSLFERSDKNGDNLGLRSHKDGVRVSFKVLP